MLLRMRKFRVLVLLIVNGLCIHDCVWGQPLITTIAGTADKSGFAGDGGPATQAKIYGPNGLCFDPAGNMYIADYNNQRVRKVDAATGNISTIAGTGAAGFGGDGGPAVNAVFNHPSRVYADKSNHLFVVDYDNYRVRSIDLGTGINTTIAGNGTKNYVNGGLAAGNGIEPAAVTMDKAGYLYIGHRRDDLGPHIGYISRLDLSTGIITTIAGNGTSGFSGDGGPAINAQLTNAEGLSFDGAGDLFFVDQDNYRVRKIAATTGIITTVAGGGTLYAAPDGTPALQAALKNPTDVLVDGDGNLIICDENDERVRKVDMLTGLLSTLAGNGTVATGPDCVNPVTEGLNDCVAAAIDADGNLCFTENASHRVRKIFTPASTAGVTFEIILGIGAGCEGYPISFYSRLTHVSGHGIYTWKVNGQDAGSDAPGLTSSTLHDGDVVNCVFSFPGTGTCSITNSITSNSLTVHVQPLKVPAVSISASSTTICKGGTVTFTATADKAGDAPSYQWLLNGQPVGDGSKTYTTAGLVDNDMVECRVMVDPSVTCTSPTDVLSSPIRIRVIDHLAPVIQVAAAENPICPGDSVAFMATVQNAGDKFSYQWLLNGVNVGDNSSAYGNAHLHDGDRVSCQLSVENNSCAVGQPVVSNTAVITIKKVPEVSLPFADTTILPGGQIRLRAVLQGDARSWQWSPAGELDDPSSLTPLTAPLTATTAFRLTVISMDGCTVEKDALVRVFYQLSMPGSFTPNGDGHNDIFRIPPAVSIQLEEFSIFDRWGNKLFSTRNVGDGWDGTLKGKACAPGVYVYFIKGTSVKGQVLSKGAVVLVR